MEQSNMTIRREGLIALALYAAPKALTYFTTRPVVMTASRIDGFREKMGILRDRFKELVGDKAWFILTDIVADNAWISHIAVSYLTSNRPPVYNLGGTIDVGTAYFSFCTVSWLARFAIVKTFPSSRGYIGTRSHS